MSVIKSPDEIAEALVADYRQVFAANLSAVIVYGSILTPDYKPGKSDINIVVVLNDDSIVEIAKSSRIVTTWAKRRVAVPFFMSRQFIVSALDAYPVEFLDIRSHYRVLFGEDVFAKLTLDSTYIRLQCERDLRGMAIHLRSSYLLAGTSSKELFRLLTMSFKKLLPICKALLTLNGQTVSDNKGGIVAAAEHAYAPGSTVLVDVYNAVYCNSAKRTYSDIFNDYVQTIDILIDAIDTHSSERISL